MKHEKTVPAYSRLSASLAVLALILAGLGAVAFQQMISADSHCIGVVTELHSRPSGNLALVVGPLNRWSIQPVALSSAQAESFGPGDWLVTAGSQVDYGGIHIVKADRTASIPLAKVLPDGWQEHLSGGSLSDTPFLAIFLGLFGMVPILHRPLFRIVFAIVLAAAGAIGMWHLGTLFQFVGWLDFGFPVGNPAAIVGFAFGLTVGLSRTCAVTLVMKRCLAVGIMLLVHASLAQALFGGEDNIVRVALVVACLISPAAALAAVSAFLLNLGMGNHPISFFAFLFITLVIVVAVDRKGSNPLLPRLTFRNLVGSR